MFLHTYNYWLSFLIVCLTETVLLEQCNKLIKCEQSNYTNLIIYRFWYCWSHQYLLEHMAIKALRFFLLRNTLTGWVTAAHIETLTFRSWQHVFKQRATHEMMTETDMCVHLCVHSVDVLFVVQLNTYMQQVVSDISQWRVWTLKLC